MFGDDIPLGDVAIRAASTNPDVVSISNDSLHKLTYHKPGEAKIVLYDKESGLYGICQIKVLPADLNIENPVFPKTVAGGSFGMALKADGTVWTWGNNEYGQSSNHSMSRLRKNSSRGNLCL